MSEARIDAAKLEAATVCILRASELNQEMAAAVAETLIHADMMGHRTHGLSLLPHYLGELKTGGMTKSGNVTVLKDHGVSFFWKANRLPGAWVLRRAIRTMIERARDHPVIIASISECFHIGALQTYLRSVTDQGLICTLSATDPSVASVAPFGGIDPVLTSNPIAYGLPTSGDPILIDLCTSVVSNSAIAKYLQDDKRLPGKWLLDNQGNLTDDARVLNATPPGTIMPIGGEAFGYKGFALGLMVEAFSLALSGYCRNEGHNAFSEGVFVQIVNPEFFAGRSVFQREMSRLVERCKHSRIPAGRNQVRLPGQRAQELFREAERTGVPVSESILTLLKPWSDKS